MFGRGGVIGAKTIKTLFHSQAIFLVKYIDLIGWGANIRSDTARSIRVIVFFQGGLAFSLSFPFILLLYWPWPWKPYFPRRQGVYRWGAFPAANSIWACVLWSWATQARQGFYPSRSFSRFRDGCSFWHRRPRWFLWSGFHFSARSWQFHSSAFRESEPISS